LPRFYVPKTCYFCAQNIREIDYKDVETLKKFISPFAKIQPKTRTGVCSHHQRDLTTAIKRARHVALLPFVSR
jgi:small subunit ribosomal protein S18